MKSTPQEIWPDPALQLKNLQQYMAKESPSLNHIAQPNAQDLSKDSLRWMYHRSPGTQLAVYPFAAAGMALGDAVRIIAIACLVVGSLGWVRWFSLFNLPVWLKFILAFSLPWLPGSTNFLLSYSPDAFVYASSPWILLAALKLSIVWSEEKKDPGIILAASILGFMMGFVYILKYTAVFASVGALAYLGIILYQIYKDKSVTSKKLPLASSATLLIFFLIPVATLSLLNHRFSNQYNFITATHRFNLQPKNIIYLISQPVLAMTGGESLAYQLYFTLFNPVPRIVTDKMRLVVFGLPGGLLFWWLIFRSRVFLKSKPALLAFTMFIANSLIMCIIWCTSGREFYSARHFISGSLAALPLVIMAGADLLNSAKNQAVKIITWLTFIAYALIPMAFSYDSIYKCVKQRKNYVTGPSHIYNFQLAQNNIQKLLNRLCKDFNPNTDIWYLTEHASALDLPGRAMVNGVHYGKLYSSEKQRFYSSRTCRVHMLLPYDWEENDKGNLIRAVFVQANGWQKRKIKQSDYIWWTTTLEPTAKETK